MRSKRYMTLIVMMFLFISLVFSQPVFAEEDLSFISSMEQSPLILRDCSDRQYRSFEENVSKCIAKEKAIKSDIKKVKAKDEKVKKSIKKLKKKAHTKKNKKKLKKLNKSHKTYVSKIKKLNRQLTKIKAEKKTAQNNLKAVKEVEPFVRVSGDVNGEHLDNLINYTVLPAGSIASVGIESAEWNEDGEPGEMRGRKTVEEYVHDAAGLQDEVVAVNGQGWGGPWATEECTYDPDSRVWSVPETETEGGWQYAVPNPNYEEDAKTDPKAKKMIGTLSYTKVYAGFRIQLSGMMKNGDEIVTGNLNSAHNEWLAFSENGDFVYGSNKKGELPPDGYDFAVSGARIVKDGEFIKNDWASGGPKTIIGTRPNGDIVLVSTVGRMDEFYSFDPYEHCKIMSYLGCDNALCMDGGGSTSMVYKFRNSDKTINIATCGYSKTNRPVANAVLFYLKDEK